MIPRKLLAAGSILVGLLVLATQVSDFTALGNFIQVTLLNYSLPVMLLLAKLLIIFQLAYGVALP